MSDWFYQLNEHIAGPISLEVLKDLVQKGVVQPETMVRNSAVGKWIPADQVRLLMRSERLESEQLQMLNGTNATDNLGTPKVQMPSDFVSVFVQRALDTNWPSIFVGDGDGWLRAGFATLFVCTAALIAGGVWTLQFSAPPPKPGTAVGSYRYERPSHQQTVSKSCGKCGKSVPGGAKPGQQCPHCGVYWSFEHERTGGTSCGACGKSVPSSARTGQQCPHCGVHWK